MAKIRGTPAPPPPLIPTPLYIVFGMHGKVIVWYFIDSGEAEIRFQGKRQLPCAQGKGYAMVSLKITFDHFAFSEKFVWLCEA